MPHSHEQAKRIIGERVELFARNLAQYRHPDYKEAHLRQEFLDPFFEALGWDVGNRQATDEVYKEVVSEDSIKVGDSTRAPDYSFRIGGVRKFFAEAKKPALLIKTDASAAYQLRRYAWSAKLPLSILSDFEELAVYDCRARPSDKDKPSVGRINFFTFDQYLDRLPEIYDVFSKEAVLRGSFDHYIQETKGKRGTTPVDAEFLKEIEGWRATLAKNIATNNPRLTLDELNDAVQRTIDRIIFLRMAEDRGAEEYGQLARLATPTPSLPRSQDRRTGEGVYGRLLNLCRDADTKYNSGLFDFSADTLTPQLKIDDDKLGKILQDLYYPQSPYEFSVLGVDTLGNVYEQFLGKVIRLTASHQAKIEEKPEVKHAGGVRYTPAYIGQYLAKQTVGKMIAGKSPQELARFRVLDIACGSGTLLLCAYDLLLDHYLKWYMAHRDEKGMQNRIYESATGWRLTTAEKKRILLAHIFGVDIDRQAVEVTKLSLLLKVLEGENQETLGKQLALFKERALPNLDANIKCGNSLIGADYFAGQLMPDADELRRVNPFDWAQAFPEIMRDGGFDCIIGNPPYIRIQTMKEWVPLEVEIYKEQYATARTGNYDIYVVFVEKGLQLLNAHGRLGFILPHKFFNAQYGEPLRALISRGKHLAHVVHFGDQQVFAGATTYTCLMFLDKAGSEACAVVKVDDLSAWRAEGKATVGTIPAASITAAEWNFTVGKGAALFEKLAAMPVKLGDVADRIFQGLVTGADPVFILTPVGKGKYLSDATQQEHRIEKELMHPLCKGSVNIRRYHIDDLTKAILFPYKLVDGKAQLLSPDEFESKYPFAWEYLRANRKALESRERGKWKHSKWYAFGRSQNLSEMEQKKILTPSIARRASFMLDATDFFYFVGSGGGGGGGYGITLKEVQQITYEYLLGVLNSKLLDAFLKSFSSPFSGGYSAYNRQYIEQLPIRAINLADAADKARHDRMVVLVTQMLELHPRLRAAQTAADREMLQRQINATDAEIDTVVYELYGLTEEEIKVVEGK